MSGRPRTPGRIHQTVSASTRRLSGHTTLLGLAVAAVGLALAYIAWTSVNGVPFQNRYELNAIVPRSAPILKEGDAVRVAGRLAGLITNVEPHRHNVRLEMELRPAFAPVGQDARTNVRVKSIVYLTYLEIYPGNVDDPMPEGGTIPLARSGSGVDLLEVVQLFDRKARETLADATYNVGLGVADRGRELNAALADVPPLTADAASQLEAATSSPGAIARTINGLRGTAAGLGGERPDDVQALIGSGSAVLGAVASRSPALGASLDLLRPVEDELLAAAPSARRLLSNATDLAAALRPALVDLAAALPKLNAVLARGDELRTQTARLTAAIDPVLIALPPIFVALRPTVASIDPLLAPLRQLIATIAPYRNDIRRSSEGLISATSTLFPEGATASGSAALRFTPIFTCHRARAPYPGPGETLGHSRPC